MPDTAEITEKSTATTTHTMRTPDGLPWPTHPLYGAFVLAAWWARYFWYRLGFGPRPALRPTFRAGLSLLRLPFRCHDRLRLIGTEHCPTHGPAVFACNHVTTYDPFYTLYAIWVGSQCGIKTHSMMRDDYFGRMNTWLIDWDEVMHLVGAFPVSRDQVRVTQLKPFVEVLRAGEAFFIYPSGTRTRSGLFMELAQGREEPGSVSFFLAQANRKLTGGEAEAIPMARTVNVVTGWNTIAFGPPMRLEADAHRAAQRAFDAALLERMGDLIELHASHALAVIFFLRAVHGMAEPRPLDALCADIRTVLAQSGHGLIAPYTESTLAAETRQAVRCFERAGLVRETPAGAAPVLEALLAVPEPSLNLWKRHPVRYLANQTLHLPGFTAAAERVVLTA